MEGKGACKLIGIAREVWVHGIFVRGWAPSPRALPSVQMVSFLSSEPLCVLVLIEADSERGFHHHMSLRTRTSIRNVPGRDGG